jgi:S-(hydroxymethyl)glutathione dehydrogenase/alcohol dehydrogenase
MRVQAAITRGDGGFSIDTFTLGDPASGEIMVEMKASGVCHTDFDSLAWSKTLVLGHEGAGIVLAVGPDVEDVERGDHVLLNWAISCGKCFQCVRGAENICENRGTVPAERFQYAGASLNTSFGLGTMATHSVVSSRAAMKIPETISFPVAAILGCGVMTGFGSAVNAAKVLPGSSVVILGCGGVGLSVIQGAHHCNAGRIVAVDINPNRLKLARRFGATDVLLADKSDAGLLRAAQQIKSITDGRGADYSFECTAVPELAAAPLAMIRNGGTAVGVSGIEQTVLVNMELFEWDKTYINPLYGQCKPSRDFPLLLDLYERGELLLDEMITRTYPLEKLDDAFHDMHSGANAKGVLLF